MPLLLYGNVENNKDIYYATGLKIQDDFYYLKKQTREYVFFDNRNYKIFKFLKNKKNNLKAISIEDILKKQRYKKVLKAHNLAFLILKSILREEKEISVNENFSVKTADYLRTKGFIIKPKAEIFDKRAIKNQQEIENIEKNLKLNNQGFDLIKQVLKRSRMENGKLLLDKNKILTSQGLKKMVEKLFIDLDLNNTHGLIIASGKQSSIPHHSGSGMIYPNTPIVCDLFPYSKKNFYYADMTRTFVKGRPSEKIKRIFEALKKTQENLIKLIKPGVECSFLHQKATELLTKMGYKTENKQGFIHSLGHG
ncbi:MAG: M24 family metallopeptidase, partial [Candidatus Moranbacteria bacterium]|nr:M24 family metallopeptidase [Candidatus Moranbacteria bacterium]